MSKHKIAVIAGDGIGKEVIPPAIDSLNAASEVCGFSIDYNNFDWSCETYASTGVIMPKNGLDQLTNHDAILLGAVGWPGVPDHISLWELLIPIRRSFNQYVNVRPVRLLEGITPPVRDREPGDINYWIVRENTEGEYSQIGGRIHEGTDREMATQVAIFTRTGCDRIIKYAFDLARKLDRLHVSSATKSNGIFHSMPYWDERFDEAVKNNSDFVTDVHHIDICAARLVTQPDFFDVIVASNLFGDILSDLGPAVTGTIAVAPSANLNPERKFPSMFEPVHGSAPDIFGKNICNPIGAIWSASMLLDHLGEKDAAKLVLGSIEKTCADPNGPKTPDLKGTASTTDVANAINSHIRASK